jgi:uncharacterized protein (DUF4415 family)
MPQLKQFEPGRGCDKKDRDAVSDNLEITVEDFVRAVPFTRASPDLAACIRCGRGPQKTPKNQVTLRFDSVVSAAFKAT